MFNPGQWIESLALGDNAVFEIISFTSDKYRGGDPKRDKGRRTNIFSSNIGFRFLELHNLCIFWRIVVLHE